MNSTEKKYRATDETLIDGGVLSMSMNSLCLYALIFLKYLYGETKDEFISQSVNSYFLFCIDYLFYGLGVFDNLIEIYTVVLAK